LKILTVEIRPGNKKNDLKVSALRCLKYEPNRDIKMYIFLMMRCSMKTRLLISKNMKNEEDEDNRVDGDKDRVKTSKARKYIQDILH
jgi:hypothetical protein